MTAATNERLFKDMYRAPSPADRPPSPLFGLRAGQARIPYFFKGAHWYNKQGERLGWGDLDFEETLRISTGLEDGELFILLRTENWNWRSNSDDTVENMEAPGIDYVARHATHIIASGKVWAVANADAPYDQTFPRGGMLLHFLPNNKVKEMLAA